MAIYSADFKGLDKLIKNFMKFGESALPYMRGAVYQADLALYRQTVINTGRLKRPSGNVEASLRIKPASRSRKSPYKILGDVHADGVKYIGPLELGHRLIRNGKWVGHVEGTSFMRDAADSTKEKVAEILVTGMDKAIRELGDK